MTDEIQSIPLLYTKNDFLKGNVKFYSGKLKSAKADYLKMVQENMKDRFTNDALFSYYFADKFMKGMTGESLSNFISGLKDYRRGRFNEIRAKIKSGLITSPEIPVRYINAKIDMFEKERYETAVEKFKSLVVDKEKSRYYSELAQLEVCNMGLSGKLEENVMIIEFQTFLAYFEDSPYVDQIRKYLRENLKNVR